MFNDINLWQLIIAIPVIGFLAYFFAFMLASAITQAVAKTYFDEKFKDYIRRVQYIWQLNQQQKEEKPLDKE